MGKFTFLTLLMIHGIIVTFIVGVSWNGTPKDNWGKDIEGIYENKDWKDLERELEMETLIKEVPQCKHHKKKKLKPNEYWSPNPFEMYKNPNNYDSKEEKVKTPPTNFQEN